MNAIDLMLDEENDLTFQLDVEGSRPGSVECRLMIEAGDMSLSFSADRYKGEEVNVSLPALDHVLKEGSYDMSLEVLVDDRIFTPLSLTANFEKGVKVTAEAVTPRRKKKGIASASLVEVTSSAKKPRVTQRKMQQPADVKESIESKDESKAISDEKIMEIIKLIQRKN
tara:strand:- start:9 stop:515 length:507 start_codon:yes stop_codon:yes gene_type:complete